MANRYDIIHIDFQASARGANAAIESIRQEADKCNTRISELKKNIAEAPKDTDAKILEGWNQELKATDRRFRQLTQAQKELMKGMRALDEGVKMFNDGSLQEMNAAFQKTVNNAAKLAQSKLTTGSKEWRDMGALMQETEQNYARMQRDTDQLIESLQNGGVVFRKTLEDEKKGLQDLLQVLPYMGTEYRKAEEQLKFLMKTTDEMAIKERQLKGEIVTTDDARRVSLQLTKEGADAARQRAAAADQEIEKGKQEIETLEKEREAREANARASAQAAAKYREDQQMYEDEIDRLQREIKAEEERAASGKTGVEAMYRKAQAAGKAADKEIEAQKKLDAEYETALGKFMALREEYEKMKQAAGSTPAKDSVAETVKKGAEEASAAIKQEAEETKKKTEAKKEDAKAGEKVAETDKKGTETAETLLKKQEGLVEETRKLIAERDKLTRERDGLVKTLEAEAAAAEKAANAFASPSKEEAEAKLKEKQAVITKGEDGKFSYTNPENAQHFLIESIKSVNPKGVSGDAMSLDSAGVAKVRAMFKERFGITDDADALDAIRGLLGGENGGLIKGGMMNNVFSRIDLNTSKVEAYSKVVKDLTDVINGEVKAVEGESEAKKKLEQVNTRLLELNEKIDANDKESREIFKLRRAAMGSEASATDKLTEKTDNLSESRRKNVEAINAQIEAIKKMSAEEANAAKKAMTEKSTVGYKSGKLDMSNPEEVQSWLITQMINHGASEGSDGTLSVGGANIDGILAGFKERYGLKGDNQKAKDLFKKVVQGKGGGGLLREGGVLDFSAETLMIKANTEAFKGRLDMLKALFDITNKASYAAAHGTETTEKETQAVKDATEATKNLTAAEQKALEVKKLKDAYDKSQAEYDKMKEHLAGLKRKKSSLPGGIDGDLQRRSLEDEIKNYEENVKSPKGGEVRRLKGQWKRAAEKLAEMQTVETAAQNQDTEATERNTQAKGRKAKASEAAAKATGEETQKSAELIAKEKELKDAEAEMVAAMERGEAQQKKTNKAVEDAETANEKAKQSEADLVKSLDEKSQKLKENKEGLEKLNEANKDTIATNEKNQQLLAETNGKIQEQGEKIRDAERIKAQAKTDGIEKTEQAIRLLTEENRHIDQNSFTWKRNTIEIQHLQEALDEMKGKPALMMMEQRMKNVGALSASAVTETKKFWETMVAGAAKGSDSLKEAEAHLKAITEEEQKRKTEANTKQADRLLGRGYLAMSEAEIRKSIDAAREYQQTLQPTEGHYRVMSRVIAEAENHLKNFGEESLRAARKQEETENLMRKQLDQGTSLSESALRTQQQYWQRLIDDPKTAAESIGAYRVELEKTIDLQRQQAESTRNERASKLGGNLSEMSEGEIREAIEAGKQLIQTYKSASPEVETLAKNIVAAEEHVKQYGVEAQRAAVREAKAVEEANKKRLETNQAMEGQLRRGMSLTESALKTQEQYWQRMADDPKAAASEIAYYFEQLNKVKQIQKEQEASRIKVGGISVLQRMRGDADYESKISENQRKDNLVALKAYRDTLPKENNLSLLQEIDYYMKQLRASAKEAGQDIMSVNDALMLAGKTGTDAFAATPQEIQMATKAIEKQRDAIIQTIKVKRDSGAATDAEEKELTDLTKKLRDLKFEQDNFNMSQAKMQELMRTPTNAVSLDELRNAIKRADGELKRMEGSLGQNSKQYKEFAEQVRNTKNMLKDMEGQAKSSATAWEKAWSRLKTYVVMYMGFNAVWQKMMGTADDLLELSDKMGEVRKTTGFTADEVGRLSDNLAKLDTRTDLTGLMEFSSLAGSIGMKTQEQVQGFTEAANMLAVSLPEMGNEASRTLMKIADATGDLEKNGGNVRETLERVGSTIIALRANSAAAAGPITDFVSRVGAVGAQAGISIDQIAALGATVDALGGRVEMSATALSRMIPAIKNNTFEVAKAIGMTEKELKNMTGMEQMVAIFRKLHDSAKGFDTSTEEGMNAMADSVEKALGRSTSMQEVMKELNQQGARAGIVFGLLSQNVDKLEEQLDTASEAYSKNVALMNEYNKMNDTAAGKWARLKNQIEEFFVTAGNTSWLGGIIDKLRVVVDLLTDEGPIGSFFRYSLVYLALLKAKWAETFGTMLISIGKFLFATKASTAASAADTAAKTAEAAATEAVGNASADASVKTGLFAKAWGKMNAAMRANIITAVAMAVYFLGSKLMDVAEKSKEAAQRIDQVADAEKKAKEESIKERAELEKLYKVTQNQNKSLDERKKALHEMVGDEKYNQYYNNLANESELAKAAAYEYSNLTAEIIKSAKARAYQQKITELTEKNLALEEKRDEAKKYVDENKASYERVSTNVANSPTAAGMFGMAAAAAQEHNDGRRKFLRDYEAKQQDIITNQDEMKKNDEDILKLESKINELNLKSLGGGDDGGSGGGGGNNNPYGDYDRVKDPYEKWDANDLVARRKEMLERVRALANGADVQKVLSEDAKFISDAVRKNIKTTSDAIEWYNTERLKIQDALHAKHLTNTGDWMDPKQQKIRRKLMQDDMKAYLEELDAYYTERKTEIDRARNDEEISEAEAWNRNIKNEAEWHRRRAELQIMYSNKHKQIAEDEQGAISAIIAERTGDDAKYIKATIANTRKFSEAVKAMNDQGAKEYRKFQGDLDLGSEKDWNKVEKALSQHLKAIEDIINKERPFNGIAKNMQDNLGKMGILTADLTEGADSAAEELKRITFLLGEAENAYTMTVENLLDDMRQNGFKEWADIISKDPSMQQGMLAMLRMTFDSVQDAIKKESSIIKKQVEIMMQDITEQAQADTTRMQILQNSVQRANSLIGAGTASERVADKLAIKQIQLQITMQETRIRMLKKAGADRVALLNQEADLLQKQGKLEEAKQKRMDAENIDKSVGLTLTKEQVELDKQRVSLAEKLEETQNRLYTSLREWADLLASSLQGVFEASHAGDAEYYNERAKLNLTGKGGPGAGTYIVIDNEGTSDAKAHYEYLDERQALERQHEIERENAQAEAWKKVMDDINMKMSESITDWMNAFLQNQAIDANTQALYANTQALYATIGMSGASDFSDTSKMKRNEQGFAVDSNGQMVSPIAPAEQPSSGESPSWKPVWQMTEEEKAKGVEDMTEMFGVYRDLSVQTETEKAAMLAEVPGYVPSPIAITDEQIAQNGEKLETLKQQEIDMSNEVAQVKVDNQNKVAKTEQQTEQQMSKGASSTYAKMAAAANMYGIAYQAMANDNLDTAQKFEMIALQAAGQAAIAALNVALESAFGKTAVNMAETASKDTAEHGSIVGPILTAISTAVLGGLMGLATSKIAKSKSQISQITGASVSAGRLATGMLTYAEGNVNEFSDPNSLTPGRMYNVDAADGRTYRAKYTGTNPKTHLTNGPEFHLSGERGREMIIDAGTTRQITMNENEIWRTIQTLSGGGRMRRSASRMGRGMKAFADGNVDEFEDVMADGGGMMADGVDIAAMTEAMNRQAAVEEALLVRLNQPIIARNIWTGPEGIPNMYNKMQKEAQRHGEKYL